MKFFFHKNEQFYNSYNYNCICSEKNKTVHFMFVAFAYAELLYYLIFLFYVVCRCTFKFISNHTCFLFI